MTAASATDAARRASASCEGLATPAVVDANSDAIADYAYAGDLFGNLWKFDLRDTNPANWRVAYTVSGNPAPIFVATTSGGVRQPITGRPTVGRGPQGAGLQVYFGTGKFLELQDRLVATITPATFYSIIDNVTDTIADIVTGRTQLTTQTVLTEESVTVGTRTNNVRTTSANPIVPPGNRGWLLDLVSPGNVLKGEMSVSNPILRNERVIFTTLTPNPDPCGFGGTSWVMLLDAKSGGRANSSFDLTGDGKLNQDDKVPSGSGPIAVSGLSSREGIWSMPTALSNGDADVLLMSSTGSEDDDPDDPNDDNNKVIDPGPGGIGRQSWRQLR